MALLKANYHTHNQLCNHATGDSEAYVKKAIELGMEELGLSDHAPIPTKLMSRQEYVENLCYRNMSVDVYENVYLPEIKEVKLKYQDKIRINLGLEAEYHPDFDEFYKKLRNDLDYLIFSAHFVPYNGECLSSYHDLNYKNIIQYAKFAEKAMATGYYKIFGHPDLFMFGYKNINGERKYDEAAVEATHLIIQASIKYGVYLELNCNGLMNSRKYASDGWMYPHIDFWSIVKEYKDAKIIIGADAHHPDALDNDDVKQVVDFAKKLKLNVTEEIDF